MTRTVLPTNPSDRTRNAALLFASILLITANNVLSPALPGLEAEFAETPNAALLTRLLISAPSAGVILFAPMAGYAADRWGRRPLLLIGAVLFLVFGLSGLILPRLDWILAARTLQGISVAMIMTAQSALIGDYFEGPARERFNGKQIAVRNYGGLVFILIAGALAALSPRLPFAIYLLGAVALPFFFFAIPADVPTSKPNAANISSKGETNWPAIAVIAAGFGLSTMLFFQMPTQLAFFARDLGLPPVRSTSLSLSALMVVGGAAAWGFGRVSASIGRKRALALGASLMAGGFLLLTGTTGLAQMMLATSLVGAGYGFLTPCFLPMALDHCPAALRGRVSGLLATAMYLGQVLSPVISQPVQIALGWSGVWGGTAILLTVLAGVSFALDLRHRGHS